MASKKIKLNDMVIFRTPGPEGSQIERRGTVTREYKSHGTRKQWFKVFDGRKSWRVSTASAERA
jgi:hypothetical protein